MLVRNLAALTFFREQAPEMMRIGDFSLNVANELTADLFLREGLSRLVPSYDLNWEQLTAMLARISPQWFEAVDAPAHADVSHGALRVCRRLV